MPFATEEIEDGTGLSTALVYGDTDACETYLSRRGRTVYVALTGNVGSEEAKVVHLLRGTEYVERLSARRVLGSRSVSTQALLFPREDVYVDDVYQGELFIPQAYINACYEAAELSAGGELFDAVVDDERDVRRQKTGQSLETEWFAPHSKVKTYYQIEEMLRPFLGSLIRLERG